MFASTRQCSIATLLQICFALNIDSTFAFEMHVEPYTDIQGFLIERLPHSYFVLLLLL